MAQAPVGGLQPTQAEESPLYHTKSPPRPARHDPVDLVREDDIRDGLRLCTEALTRLTLI